MTIQLVTPPRRFGWRKDTAPLKGTLALKRYGASGPLPRQWNGLLDFVGGVAPEALPRLDQQTTLRCVAFSAAEAMWTTLRAKGRPGKLANIRHGYIEAQREAQRRMGIRAALVDQGLEPTDLLTAYARRGTTVFADASPETLRDELDPARCLEDMTVDEIELAATHRITDWNRIDDGAEEATIIDEAKRFSMAGYGGMAGFNLNAAFQAYETGVWTRDPNDASEGGHMLSGPYAWDDDMGAFCMLNHWGDWGLMGTVYVSYKTYASSFVSDRVHVDAAEILEAA